MTSPTCECWSGGRPAGQGGGWRVEGVTPGRQLRILGRVDVGIRARLASPCSLDGGRGCTLPTPTPTHVFTPQSPSLGPTNGHGQVGPGLILFLPIPTGTGLSPGREVRAWGPSMCELAGPGSRALARRVWPELKPLTLAGGEGGKAGRPGLTRRQSVGQEPGAGPGKGWEAQLPAARPCGGQGRTLARR